MITPDDVTALELACGMVHGGDPQALPLPPAPVGVGARAALEDAVRAALLRPPCVVSFSGGRDSSAVLALAVHVARRDGLPLPVPVSQRFPGRDAADEDEWQELVVRHLGLADWTRRAFTDELDNLGPYARTVLQACGPLWPSNAHFHLPVAEQAAGGTVLTGFGGDELLDTGWVWRRVNELLVGRHRWRPRDLARLLVAYGPAGPRRMVLRRSRERHYSYPWLRPAAVARVVRASMSDLAAEPVRWDRGIDRAWWRTRYRRTAERSLARVGALCAAQVRHPLTDATVLAAVAREGGRVGFDTRAAAMAQLFGDLLPPALVRRRSKAILTGAFWNRPSRAFAAAWDRTGLDPDLVDLDALATMWRAPQPLPDARTFGLLQSAWLASGDRAVADRVEQRG